MPVRVPLLDLGAQYEPLRDEILAAVTRVCDSQRYIMGPEITAFEEEIASLIGVRHAVSVSSGTDAVLLALMVLGIGPGDEVVTSTYSFFATAGAIVRVGARPVLVDIDPVTFNLNPEQLTAAITPRTKAVMPVHLFGLSADMDPILAAAAARTPVPIIEDAAQAIGATYRGRPAGGIGAIGGFSFFPSKNLGAFGDAGLLTTNDANFATRARLLRNHGMEPKYYHHAVGANFRMDALQAAILRVKAPHLAAWTEARRVNASHPVPFHLQPCFTYLGYRQGDFPVAERAADESLAIPIYSELTVQQQQTVVDAIAEFLSDHPVPRGADQVSA